MHFYLFFSFFSLSRRNFSILLSRFPNSCFSSLFKKIWFFGSLYHKIYNFESSNPKKVFLGGKKLGFAPVRLRYYLIIPFNYRLVKEKLNMDFWMGSCTLSMKLTKLDWLIKLWLTKKKLSVSAKKKFGYNSNVFQCRK